MKKSKETFPYILKETPLETHLCKKLHRTTKGIIYSIYGIINGKLPIYEKKINKREMGKRPGLYLWGGRLASSIGTSTDYANLHKIQAN